MIETNQLYSGKQEFLNKYQIKQTTFRCIILKELSSKNYENT